VPAIYERRLNGGKIVHLTGKLGMSRLLLTPSGTTTDGQQVYVLYLVEPDQAAVAEPPVEKRERIDYARRAAEAMFTPK
jgi:hypothetical protein